MDDTRFLSTDPASADFLVPDWSVTEVSTYIVDKGWEEAGVKDPDGSRADLGAIPSGGGRPKDVLTIRPSVPVEITGNTAKIGFIVSSRLEESDVKDLKMVYFYIVTNLDTSDCFGNAYKAISTRNILKIAIPAKQIILGANTIEVTLPSGGTGDFAFFEMVLEATGSDGRKFTSAVGFIPYRKLDFHLDVVVLDKPGGTAVTTVRAGDKVYLQVTPRTATGPFNNKIDSSSVYLQSRADLPVWPR